MESSRRHLWRLDWPDCGALFLLMKEIQRDSVNEPRAKGNHALQMVTGGRRNPLPAGAVPAGRH